MTTAIVMIIILLVWIAIAKVIFKHEFSLNEMGIQAAITAVAIVILVMSGAYYQTKDYKFVNGVVTELNPKKEQCNQFWSDFPDGFCTNQYTRTVRDGETCSTDTKGNRTCVPRYKTQYKSVYPWEIRYFVKSDIPSLYEIERVDDQGAKVPPRFSEISIGDPVSELVEYTNYIKGAAGTLFNQKYEDVPPIAYPKVYDYYKARRVIYFGASTNFEFANEWDEQLAVLNSEIRKTGANVIIAVTSNTQDWSERLAQAWDAHNINDIVVTIGVNGENISWVDVRSWSENDMVNITIRDEILNLKVVDKQRINDIIKSSVQEFYKEQPMENFEYLAEDIPAPMWMYILAAILLLVITPLVTFFFIQPKNRF
jgi:hypothetical protein